VPKQKKKLGGECLSIRGVYGTSDAKIFAETRSKAESLGPTGGGLMAWGKMEGTCRMRPGIMLRVLMTVKGGALKKNELSSPELEGVQRSKKLLRQAFPKAPGRMLGKGPGGRGSCPCRITRGGKFAVRINNFQGQKV